MSPSAALPSDPESFGTRGGTGRLAYEILYRPEPAWLVPSGEHEGEAYPGDYAGRITAVAPAGRKTVRGAPKSFGRRNSRTRAVAVMRLTPEEASLAGARRVKVISLGPGAWGLEPVLFEDEWGAIAAKLAPFRETLEDESLRDSDALVERMRHELAHGYADALTHALPAPQVHTGAGYYRVDNSDAGTSKTVSGSPAKDNGTSTFTVTVGGMTADEHKGKLCTFQTSGNDYTVVSNAAATVTVQGDASGEAADQDVVIDSLEFWQDAFDKLYEEQGSAAFTVEQVIEGYEGPYAEYIDTPGLAPRARRPLRMRAASGETVVITSPADVAHTCRLDRTYIIVSGLEFNHAGGATQRTIYIPGQLVSFECCVFKNDAGGWAVYGVVNGGQQWYDDCEFHAYSQVQGWFVGCKFFSGVWPNNRSASFISCIFDGGSLTWNEVYPIPFLEIRHCVFYNASCGGVARQIVLLNNIFYRDDGNTGLKFSTDSDLNIVSDHNCIFCDKASPIYLSGVNYTFAEWQALGYDEHSLNADPKMADPAGGDFSLDSDSPCRRKGAGAGVEKDKAGDVFDAFNPDMGAYSTGSGLPSEPSVESVSASGTSVTVTVSGDAGATSFARLLADDGQVDDESSRTGDGDISLTSSAENVFTTVVSWSELNERARSKPVGARPPRYFLSGGATTNEIASAIVSALIGSPALTALLGSSDAVYLSHPPKDAALPCLVYELALRRVAHGVEGELRLSAWAKTAGQARQVMEEAENVLQEGRMETMSYVARKPLVREVESGFDREARLRFERARMIFRAHGK